MHPRQKAAEHGETTYDGKPCKNCGNTLRYTLNASCCHCANEQSKVRVAARRAEIKTLLDQAKGVA